MNYDSALVAAATATQPQPVTIPDIRSALIQFLKAEKQDLSVAQNLVRQLQESRMRFTPDIQEMIIHCCQKFVYNYLQTDLAIDALSILVNRDETHFEALTQLALYLQNKGRTQEGLAIAYQSRKVALHPLDLIFANYLVMRGMMMACNGYFVEHAEELKLKIAQQLKNLGQSQMEANTTQMIRLFSCNFWNPYLSDDPKQFAQVLSFTHQAVVKFLQETYPHLTEKCAQLRRQVTDPGHVRVGFIGHTCGRHSVGYLLRHLIYHLDRSNIQLFCFMVLPKHEGVDPLQEWFANNTISTQFYTQDAPTIAQNIADHHLDILIDLDSITMDITQAVMAFHPAKVTMSWLGFDAARNPSTDYYITDPYTLPREQSGLYLETPLYVNNLVGVNGFEAGLPSITRNALDITNEFVYLVIQRSHKLHPFMCKQYMEVLKHTCNSVLVLKCPGDADLVKNFMYELADYAVIDRNRIKFMPVAANEQVHRANIVTVADVILDSYPYSGATTTLEALWFGIPTVTYKGEQFSSRTTASFISSLGCDYLGVAETTHEFLELAVNLHHQPERYVEYQTHLRKARQQNKGIWNAQAFADDFKDKLLSVLD